MTADAFAFFGATGDLARKMIFPALHRLARTGRLAIPVIGVAFSGWDAKQPTPVGGSTRARPEPMTRMALVMLLFIAPASLAHATYRLHSLPGMIQLDQGSGSASEVFVGLTPHVVYGELDGQSVAAVVLVTTAGGTGSFFELAVMAAGASGPRNIATVVLGDRVRLLSLSLHDNEITVDLVRAGPYDSLCCPTQRMIERYELRGPHLTRTAQEPWPRD